MNFRRCPGCGEDISHRGPRAIYCEHQTCQARDLHRRRRDAEARNAAAQLALSVSRHGMKATITKSELHGWCIRATLPHGPVVYFTDDEDLDFYLADRAVPA